MDRSPRSHQETEGMIGSLVCETFRSYAPTQHLRSSLRQDFSSSTSIQRNWRTRPEANPYPTLLLSLLPIRDLVVDNFWLKHMEDGAKSASHTICRQYVPLWSSSVSNFVRPHLLTVSFPNFQCMNASQVYESMITRQGTDQGLTDLATARTRRTRQIRRHNSRDIFHGPFCPGRLFGFAVYYPNTGVLPHNRVETTTKVRHFCLRNMWLTSNSRSIRLWASRGYAYIVKLS